MIEDDANAKRGWGLCVDGGGEDGEEVLESGISGDGEDGGVEGEVGCGLEEAVAVIGEHVEGGGGGGGERPGFDVLWGLKEEGIVAEGGEKLEGWVWVWVGVWGGRHAGWLVVKGGRWKKNLRGCLLDSFNLVFYNL